MRALLIGLLVASLLPFAAALPSAEATACEFTLGFKALHDQMPSVVGDCRVNEHHNAMNGDGLQETTGIDGKGGLLVWRKADNWTAYTDGFRTWIAGPAGLQQRLNTERFPWEQEIPPPPQSRIVTEWSLHQDGDRSFKYPTGWVLRTRESEGMANHFYHSPDGKAFVYFVAPLNTGNGFKPEDALAWTLKAWDGHSEFVWGGRERTDIGGHPAVLQWFEFPNGDGGFEADRGVAAAIQVGEQTHWIDGRAAIGRWAEYEPILLEVIRSYRPKQ
jgi:hypothetical protein